jgi:serine/threonine-protein kinase
MRRFGSFALAARLGRGGSAEVWRAVHEGPHGFARAVALKRLLPERLADEQLRASLLDEARLAARLTHPNVAQVLDVVEADGEHAIVMELVDGCDLRTLMKALTRLGAPAPGLGAYVAHEVCRALGAAHAERPLILHRDVSATNVLVSRDGTVKLTDFGIGKALEQAEREGTISIKGNLGYMAPEQLTRAPVSPTTDVYAAGVLLWEMLTGRRLFAAAFELATATQARARPIPPPSTVNAAVPAALDDVVARATAAAPAARFADGAAMARALEADVHALGFGPTQLAALMRDFAPPPVDDEPQRHTVSAVARAPAPASSATATVVDPPGVAPRIASRIPPRVAPRSRMWLAALVGATAGVGAFAAWPRHVEELVPPARPVAASPSAPQPIAEPLPLPPPPPPLPLTTPIAVERHTVRKPPPKPPAKSAPDLTQGKLLNPFGH